MIPDAPHDRIIVEGCHLRRGHIATLCARVGLPASERYALSWGPPYSCVCESISISRSNLDGYYDCFRELLERNEDALFIPCTQKGTILANAFKHCRSILAEPTLMNVAAFDKILLKKRQRALTQYFPPYGTPSTLGLSFPLLAKPRYGHSTSDQHHLHSHEDLKRLVAPDDYFVESIIPPPFQEYSLTAVRSRRGVKWMCVCRDLQQFGRTMVASTVHSPTILAVSAQIVGALEFDTLYNVQFALRDGQPVIYDLNPRFGHSELFRACFGFNFIASYHSLPSSPLDTRQSLTEEDALNILSRY